MRRADRLFEIIQRLRRRRVVTAGSLAEQFKVSERTIYRDIRDLTASKVVNVSPKSQSRQRVRTESLTAARGPERPSTRSGARGSALRPAAPRSPRPGR